MLLLGAHTSAAGGVYNALEEARDIGANVCQLFTANQRQWNPRNIFTDQDLRKWHQLSIDYGIGNIMSHASYLINLGSCKEELLEKSRRAFEEEIKRCHRLGISFLNFHPGAATTSTTEECLSRIVESLNSFGSLCAQGKTILVVEATAGQGTTVGWKFEHLAHLIERVDQLSLKVCIDTCHIFAAGYDIRTAFGCNKVLEEFDRIVGLEHLVAFHINDSKSALSSRVDRHACLGKGEIGKECFEFLVNDPRTRSLPMYLETPDPEKYAEEINWLREVSYVKS